MISRDAAWEWDPSSSSNLYFPQDLVGYLDLYFDVRHEAAASPCDDQGVSFIFVRSLPDGTVIVLHSSTVILILHTADSLVFVMITVSSWVILQCLQRNGWTGYWWLRWFSRLRYDYSWSVSTVSSFLTNVVIAGMTEYRRDERLGTCTDDIVLFRLLSPSLFVNLWLHICWFLLDNSWISNGLPAR
jgi:hypothetical protein